MPKRHKISPPVDEKEVSDFMQSLLTERLAGGERQTDIATRSGLTDGTLCDVHHRKRGVGLKTLMGLMKAFDVTFAQLPEAAAAWRNGVRPASHCLPSSTVPAKAA